MDALSQSEIDALLTQTQGLDEEQGNKASSTKEKAVFTYNFRKQKKFNKSDFVLLESIHKRFLRNIEVTLTNVLSSPVMATLAAATELSYSDCMDSFSSPTCIYILELVDGSGKFILEIDPNFAFFVIDKILGGNSREVRTMDRELSLIEERIMLRVVNFLITDLSEAWERVQKLSFEIDAFYAQPDYVQVISSTESVILISMDVRSSDKTLGYVNLCIPSGVLESLLLQYDKTSEKFGRAVEQSESDRKGLYKQVNNSILPLRVVLGQTRMAVEDLLNLDNGDVIFLSTEAKMPVDVYVGNLNLFKGTPVERNNSIAIKISDIIRVNNSTA